MNSSYPVAEPSLFLLALAFLAFIWFATIRFRGKRGAAIVVVTLLFFLVVPLVSWVHFTRVSYMKQSRLVQQARQSHERSATAVISHRSENLVGAGKLWRDKKLAFDRIADKYASAENASQCVARQCAYQFTKLGKLAPKSISVAFSGDFDQPTREAFLRSLGEHLNSQTKVQEVTQGQDISLGMNIADTDELSRSKKPITLIEITASLAFDNVMATCSARYQDLPWVWDLPAFQQSEDAPSEYFVAHGEYPSRTSHRASNVAMAELHKRIEQTINSVTPHHRAYVRSPQLMDRLASSLEERLTIRWFTQNFNRDLDGNHVDYGLRREVRLLDCSRVNLREELQSVIAAISRGRGYPAHDVSGEELFGYSMMSGAILGVISGTSWWFDRKKKPRPIS